MTNHIHFLVTPHTETAISKAMSVIGSRYAYYFNRAYKRTGTIWEGRHKSSLVQSERYLLACMRYIELNPVVANMVSKPEEYKWSSFKSNGWGHGSRLWTPHAVYSSLGKTIKERTQSYREMFKAHLDVELLNQVRQSINQGLALGNERFKETWA